MIEVLQAGVYSSIQDSGRKGFEAYGVPPGGILDPYLAGIANKLAGNPKGLPVLEFALIGPSLKFEQSCCAAISGYDCEYLLNGRRVNSNAGFYVESGSTLTFQSMQGWFGYLAVSGGFSADRVLNSVSDFSSGPIGSRLFKGQLLETYDRETFPHQCKEALTLNENRDTIYILPAIHTALFDKVARNNFVRHNFQVTSQSNRMGIRLSGQLIEVPEVIRSVPSLPGTIQITRSGESIILGPEGPTTGGYAQIAILTRASWATLASQRPGKSIRFQWTNVSDARKKWESRNRILESEELWERIS